MINHFQLDFPLVSTILSAQTVLDEGINTSNWGWGLLFPNLPIGHLFEGNQDITLDRISVVRATTGVYRDACVLVVQYPNLVDNDIIRFIDGIHFVLVVNGNLIAIPMGGVEIPRSTQYSGRHVQYISGYYNNKLIRNSQIKPFVIEHIGDNNEVDVRVGAINMNTAVSHIIGYKHKADSDTVISIPDSIDIGVGDKVFKFDGHTYLWRK